MTPEEKIPILFNQNEEAYAIFKIEDLIKEYNSHVILNSSYQKNTPISLRPSSLSNLPMIRAMTKEEIDAMRSQELHAADWFLLKKILTDQYATPSGFLSNIPTLTASVSIVEMVRELGLQGKVSYKTTNGKTYVIIKGYAGERTFLKGTRYLNTHPEIVRFGLAKVNVKDMIKTGFKSSIWIYGGIKTVEAVELCLLKDGLEPGFFSNVGIDIPKITVTTLVSAAAGGAVAAAGFPVAVGAGIVLTVGVGTGIALEYIDQKLGITDKVSKAAETMWQNLKSLWGPSAEVTPKSHAPDLLFGVPFIWHSKLYGAGDPTIYTA